MEEIRYKEHVVYFEPPDIVLVRWNGDMPADAMAWYCAQIERFAADKLAVFLLADNSRAGTMPADSRKLAAQETEGKMRKARGSAIFGSSFHHRVLVRIILTIVELFKRGKTSHPVRLFDTEQEARAWIAERRAEVLGQRQAV